MDKTLDDKISKPQQEKTDDTPHCEECHSSHFEMDDVRGELVCANCGLVQTAGDSDSKYDHRGPRAFSSEQADEKSHSGSASTLTIHDKGLSTEISPRDKDSYGKSIPTRNRYQMYRLRKWQRRIRVSNATERNLAFAMQELEREASQMQLPRNVRETTAYAYRKAVNKNIIRGRSIEGVVAASLYYACRQHGIPRTLDEIAEVTKIGRREIGRTYRFMMRALKLSAKVSTARDYIPRFCSELKLNSETQTKILEILVQAEEKQLISGRGPTGMAAAAIYIVSFLSDNPAERRTQKEIADMANVTEVTVRNRYKELVETLGIAFPQFD